MKRNTAGFERFGAGLLGLMALGWVLAGSAGAPVHKGLATDWTHQHVIYSQPSTEAQAKVLAGDPRFLQQEYRLHAFRVMAGGTAAPEELNSLATLLKGVPAGKVHRDWSQFMGLGASSGAGNYPAKFDFDPNIANCATPGPGDFVVFSTGLFGQGSAPPTQADIVAYNNLYSGCTGTVPQVYWAYNLNGGKIPTSPVFSQEGTQLAFTGTNGTSSHFVLLTWKASTTDTVSSPTFLLPSGLNSYPGCGGAPPCFASIQLQSGGSTPVDTDDTNSSVFYDYANDTAWVGDNAGWLHEFNPVFKGIPAEIRNGTWPVLVNPANPKPLSSPVHDPVSDNVFVGDTGGLLASVNATTGAVTLSGQLDFGPGIVAGPILDPTAGFVYVFASNDGTTGAQSCGTGPCAAVYALSTTFASGTKGNSAQVGTGSATVPMYRGGFDSTYLSSNNGTGKLRVCGNTGGAPTLYQLGVSLGAWFGVFTGPALASSATGCSPVTDSPNPNVAGGPTEWIFASAQNNGTGNSCASGGCVMNFMVEPHQPSTAYVIGQQIVDNMFQVEVVTRAGTSQAGGPPTWGGLGTITIDGTAHWINTGVQTAFHAAWAPTTAYVVNDEILDSNNHVQLVTVAGTSGGSTPTWKTLVNGRTTDGGVTWRNVGAVATVSLAAAGGSSAIIVDNTVVSGTLAGTSQIYYSTQGNQTCGASGTGGCAVQASQSALQ